MTKSPDAIQVKTVSSISRRVGSIPTRRQASSSATANDASITRQARPPDTVFESRRPMKALTRKPTKGKNGISLSTPSPFERREGFRIERLAVAEKTDDERKADSGFSGRHGHHEEGDDLSVHGPELPA